MYSRILILLTTLALVACTPIGTTSESTSRLNLAVSDEPSTLDLHRTSEQGTHEILDYVCEPLIYRGIDLLDHPLLADSWQMSEDGLSLRVNLRQDIVFHDGTPLTADAVRITFERLQKPESMNSPVYEDFADVQIDVIDDHSLTFSFAEPSFDFIDTLQNPFASIVSPTTLEADDGTIGRGPICTGPYKVLDWTASQSVLLGKFSEYAWPPAYYENQGAALIDEILISFVSEHDTRYLAFVNGELDILSLSTSEEVTEVAESDDYSLYESWIGGISYLGFNYQRPPTNESELRQALAHAIDKETIINTILPGLADPAFAPLAPSILGFSPELAAFEYEFDPETSERLLDELGFVDEDGDGIREKDGVPLSLELLTTTSSTYGKIFTFLQEQLRRVGVDVKIRAVPTSEIAEITPTGDFDLLLYHYNWPYPSALSLFLSTERVGASNRVGYSNPSVDDLLAQIDDLPDDSAIKAELLFEAQKLILQDVPWQPLLVRKMAMGTNSRVKGIRAHPQGGLLLHDAYIE